VHISLLLHSGLCWSRMEPKQRWLGFILVLHQETKEHPRIKWSLSCRHAHCASPFIKHMIGDLECKNCCVLEQTKSYLRYLTLVQCYWPRSGVRFWLVVNECLVLNKVEGNTVINKVTVVLCKGGDKGETCALHYSTNIESWLQ
jgi:hypothetical protein